MDDKSYQVRMPATHILGQLSSKNPKALKALETKVSADDNWRVQEMLAKALDCYSASIGYKNSLSKIKYWLSAKNPNVQRAVVEGLRVWTSRPYFKENPETAIRLITQSKSTESEHLRKSIGNSLRDIRKNHKKLIDAEISRWDLTNNKLLYVQKLVQK